MLKDQIEGKNNSWAVRWYASAFLKNKLTLYSKDSFVQNIGIDGSGTHGGIFNFYKVKLFNSKKYISFNEPIEHKSDRSKFEFFFKRKNMFSDFFHILKGIVPIALNRL
ncbi:MAG: hypothetical protein PHD05_03000 [Sphaerochaetaceae bacterium]|nr:hypothetical protein [Sphaerochaetaceae bacterium]